LFFIERTTRLYDYDKTLSDSSWIGEGYNGKALQPGKAIFLRVALGLGFDNGHSCIFPT
jgi:hypothetical protein